jgi:hypothetical protein
MPKGKLRVRHLTLAPVSDHDVDRGDETSNEEVNLAQLRLDLEKLSMAIEIFVAASKAGRKRSSHHIIEHGFVSNFWA